MILVWFSVICNLFTVIYDKLKGHQEIGFFATKCTEHQPILGSLSRVGLQQRHHPCKLCIIIYGDVTGMIDVVYWALKGEITLWISKGGNLLTGIHCTWIWYYWIPAVDWGYDL